MRKNKQRKRYNRGMRIDYTQGGRVGYQIGGENEREIAAEDEARFEDEQEFKSQYEQDNPPPSGAGGAAGSKAVQNYNNKYTQAYKDYLASKNNTGTTTTDPNKEAEKEREKDFQEKRDERIGRTAEAVETASKGTVPDSAKIPDPDQMVEGTPMATTTMATPTTVVGSTATPVGPEAVTEVQDTAQVSPPEELRAAQMEAAQVTESPEVVAARSEVRDESLAKAAKVDRVAPIEGAEVDIPEGALAGRVVGTISEGAKAAAAVNAGTSLARITRAKKQLSQAGLTESQINEIGNDPVLLEDRLADFSEEERGIIEGLPQEALVSTQISGLLEGIENGTIPPWASPAVAQVEQMLAARGLSASSVGRDSLLNTIIQAALPIAQSNAQAIQQSVAQQKDIEFKTAEANAQRLQQTALKNADNVFKMNMAQFSADQQTALFNSKFLQTVGLTEANFDQQATVQNAVLLSQANLAEADFYQKSQIQNAQAFLQTDMANLNAEQQSNVLRAQQDQQRLLSNQAAENAARNANMVSDNQMQQFSANLNFQTKQFNAQQTNAMKQFNANAKNAAAARDANRTADLNKFNAQLATQVEEFNSQQDFARNQWNAQNSAAVEASNVEWRRKINTVNTAAQNQVNMQNAMNAFNLSSQSLSFLWQELRDEADFDFRSSENAKAQITQLRATAIANEAALAEKSRSSLDQVVQVVEGMITNYYS